mgnify:CR=1 FL=1
MSAAKASMINAPIAKPLPCKWFISSWMSSIAAHNTSRLPKTVNIPFSIPMSEKKSK